MTPPMISAHLFATSPAQAPLTGPSLNLCTPLIIHPNHRSWCLRLILLCLFVLVPTLLGNTLSVAVALALLPHALLRLLCDCTSFSSVRFTACSSGKRPAHPPAGPEFEKGRSGVGELRKSLGRKTAGRGKDSRGTGIVKGLVGDEVDEVGVISGDLAGGTFECGE